MSRHVNILEAKTQLSRLVDAVENGTELEIVIARNGKPAARIVALQENTKQKVRLGLADGKYPVMTQEEFDADNEGIWSGFHDKRPFG